MITTDKFHWDKNGNTFSADITDLGSLNQFQAYPDACDVGFDLISSKTGQILRMVQCEDKTNQDGDILYWKFKPVDRKYHFVVTIFND